MCCCKRSETSCEALILDPVVLVLSSGSRSNPRFFGQLVYSLFFVGGFGLASAPASPVSSQHEVIFTKKKQQKNSFSACERLCRRIHECSSAGSRLRFLAHRGRSRRRLARGNTSELALKKNYKSIKKFLNYLSAVFCRRFASSLGFCGKWSHWCYSDNCLGWSLSSVWLRSLRSNDRPLSKYSHLNLIIN